MSKAPRTIYLVKRLETLIRARLEAALESSGLTPGQYTTLSVVNAGPISSADLSRRVGITPQSTSEVIATLERKGLIARTARDDNRRIADATLTAAGKTLLKEADRRVDILEQHLLEGLSPSDDAAFRHLLERILS